MIPSLPATNDQYSSISNRHYLTTSESSVKVRDDKMTILMIIYDLSMGSFPTCWSWCAHQKPHSLIHMTTRSHPAHIHSPFRFHSRAKGTIFGRGNQLVKCDCIWKKFNAFSINKRHVKRALWSLKRILANGMTNYRRVKCENFITRLQPTRGRLIIVMKMQF